MGSTRFGRIIEKDRDSARALTLFVPGHHAVAAAGTWTDGFDATNNDSFMSLASGAVDLNPAYVFILHGGLFVSGETADAAKGEVVRGPRINSMSLIYAITGNALDNHVATLDTHLYADNAAPTFVNRPITGTLQTGVTMDPDNPRVTALTVTTPFTIASAAALVAKLRVRVDQAAGGSAYRLYGLLVSYDLLI